MSKTPSSLYSALLRSDPILAVLADRPEPGPRAPDSPVDTKITQRFAAALCQSYQAAAKCYCPIGQLVPPLSPKERQFLTTHSVAQIVSAPLPMAEERSPILMFVKDVLCSVASQAASHAITDSLQSSSPSRAPASSPPQLEEAADSALSHLKRQVELSSTKEIFHAHLEKNALSKIEHNLETFIQKGQHNVTSMREILSQGNKALEMTERFTAHVIHATAAGLELGSFALQVHAKGFDEATFETGKSMLIEFAAKYPAEIIAAAACGFQPEFCAVILTTVMSSVFSPTDIALEPLPLKGDKK